MLEIITKITARIKGGDNVGRRSRKNAAIRNGIAYKHHLNNLLMIASTRFKWENLPAEIDERFLETTLCERGSVLFFEDDVLGFLTLPFTYGGALDVYRNPILRNAYAVNGYRRTCDKTDSVIIYNNYIRISIFPELCYYAEKLAVVDRMIEINLNLHRHPKLLICDESELATMKATMRSYDDFEDAIYGKKGLNLQNIQAIDFGVPYICDKLWELKLNIYNEVLSYLGVQSVPRQKNAHVIESEINAENGATYASSDGFLMARLMACEQINYMWGLNVSVHYNDTQKIMNAVQTALLEPAGGGGNG